MNKYFSSEDDDSSSSCKCCKDSLADKDSDEELEKNILIWENINIIKILIKM